ncbi:MAG: transcription-repair coupling factor [Oscillospiraceae bacterium]|nr:transcription-repair coupling factor [Oscillospiraceae bacterium]
MLSLCEALWALPEAQELLSRITSGGCPVAMGGLSSAHKAHFIAAARRKTGRPVVVLCPDEAEAARIASDSAVFAEEETLKLPCREFSFAAADTMSREWEHARLASLRRVAAGTAPILAGTADAFMQRTLPPEKLRETVTVKPGTDASGLPARLAELGYTRCEQVEGMGQFAVRGGIIDVFSPGMELFTRIELYGDEVDTLHSCDRESQLRISPLASCDILPCREAVAATEEIYTALDYLPRNTLVFIIEQGRVGDRIKHTLWIWHEETERALERGEHCPRFGIEDTDLWNALKRFDCVMLDLFLAQTYPLRPHAMMNVTAKQLPSFGASLETAVGDIAHYRDGGGTTIVFVPTERQARHLEELLRDRGLPGSVTLQPSFAAGTGGIYICSGFISSGLEYPGIKLAVLTEGQTASRGGLRKRVPAPKGKDAAKKKLVSYTDLEPGDLVVHEHHGIGRFTGITTMTVDGLKRDYINLSYAGADTLYVPVTQLHLVSKYIGGGEESVARLNKLGGVEWTKAKARAKAAAKELAAGLVKLYAERKRRVGFAFPKDDDWQAGFEDAFEYEETDDQLRCALEIKKDMENLTPMDRLLCGDVGFGKTEVALRAVMKCVLGGKQAAMLVPTTVLAQQHGQTANRRFAGYPVRVDVLSRFCTPAAAAAIKKKLRSGQLDFVIGTHKLLQKELKFANLGLLVVDEEQRFGVSHKERLKELAKQVDVLTLTATPIPRTLHMALSGIRDMSNIEEAPRDRTPVQTYVLEYDRSLIHDAVRREVGRGGQVYYLHNRVETIDRAAAELANALPDVSVAAAHGQMKEGELSDIMRQVVDGQIQVLVCTTIIEAGLDIPNVNTLIIEDADKLGLAQLHQIRGRVGRSNRHAFAYLTYRRGKILAEIAAKRLAAIREFAEFGSGLKIAMRDLEIRGAGNLLGAEQSGHMLSVGYEMYLRLLEEAVLEEQGIVSKPKVDCVADLPVRAALPEDYIAHAGIRMDFYRRIAAVTNENEASDLIDELIDRFGELPDEAQSLFEVALVRAAASKNGFCELAQKGGRLLARLPQPDFIRVARICGLPEYKGKILFSAGNEPHLSLKLVSGEDILEAARRLVEAYGG